MNYSITHGSGTRFSFSSTSEFKTLFEEASKNGYIAIIKDGEEIFIGLEYLKQSIIRVSDQEPRPVGYSRKN
jgi:capsid portal protein